MNGFSFPLHYISFNENSVCVYSLFGITLVIHFVSPNFSITVMLVDDRDIWYVYYFLGGVFKFNSFYDHLVVIYVMIIVSI